MSCLALQGIKNDKRSSGYTFGYVFGYITRAVVTEMGTFLGTVPSWSGYTFGDIARGEVFLEEKARENRVSVHVEKLGQQS